jgi:peroxiredoxin
MSQVELNTPAPDFTLPDFQGRPVRLADFRGQKHVVLVFNRGFV